MSQDNLKYGTQLETATRTGDIARGVVYTDRRLRILKDTVDANADCREAVLEAVKTYPTYQNAVESMQYVAAVYNETHKDSSVFIEMMSGKLIRNWRNSLVALHVRMTG